MRIEPGHFPAIREHMHPSWAGWGAALACPDCLCVQYPLLTYQKIAYPPRGNLCYCDRCGLLLMAWGEAAKGAPPRHGVVVTARFSPSGCLGWLFGMRGIWEIREDDFDKLQANAHVRALAALDKGKP